MPANQSCNWNVDPHLFSPQSTSLYISKHVFSQIWSLPPILKGALLWFHASQLGGSIPQGFGQLKRCDARKVSQKKTQILKNDSSILKCVKLAMMPCTTHNFMVDLLVWILHRQKSNWLCFSSCFSQIWHYFCLHGNFMVTSLCRPPSGNKALIKIKLNNNWRNIEKSWCFVFPIFEINKAVVLKPSRILGVVYGGSPHSWKVPEPSTVPPILWGCQDTFLRCDLRRLRPVVHRSSHFNVV